MDTSDIWICMGSSCYARGNSRNAELIQAWIEAKGAQARLTVAGTLCEGRCREGPIVKIGDRLFTGVTPDSVIDILDHVLGGRA